MLQISLLRQHKATKTGSEPELPEPYLPVLRELEGLHSQLAISVSSYDPTEKARADEMKILIVRKELQLIDLVLDHASQTPLSEKLDLFELANDLLNETVKKVVAIGEEAGMAHRAAELSETIGKAYGKVGRAYAETL